MDKDTQEALSIVHNNHVKVVPLSSGNWAIFDHGFNNIVEVVPSDLLISTILRYMKTKNKVKISRITI